MLEDGFTRQIESSKKNRGVTELSSSTRERERESHSTSQRVAEEFGGQSKKTYGHSEGLRQRSDGQTSRSESNDRTRVSTDKGNERNRSTGNDFDIEKKQELLLQGSDAALQKVLENGKNEMMQNNDQTIQQLQEIQSNLNKQMNEIKIYMQTEIKSIRKKTWKTA
ncbi:hypothetical protein GCM10020331_010360 [Ectobacillus funiculus]